MDDDPFSDLAGISPVYDAWKAQQKMARQQDHMALRNIDPTTDEGSNGLLRILGRNPELYNRPEIKGLVGISQTAMQKRDMLEQRKAALKAQTDMQQAQLDHKKALDEAKMAEAEARKASAAKLKAFYTLPRPGEDGYDEGFNKAIDSLEPDELRLPEFQAVIKAHEPFRVAVKPPKPDKVPTALNDKYIDALEAYNMPIDDMEKELAFEDRRKRKLDPKSKADWDEAYNLVFEPRKRKLQALAKAIESMKSGRLPGLEEDAPLAELPMAAPAIPVVNSREEAMKLPKGTVFMTPDGRKKVVP